MNITKSHPTPRAPDKCGRSAALSGLSPNGGFGVWWFFPLIPALVGNACRSAGVRHKMEV